MSYYPKLVMKMNGYFTQFFSRFEAVVHPAGGKSDGQKTKRRSTNSSSVLQASPDSLNMRASVRKYNPVRRNPAP